MTARLTTRDTPTTHNTSATRQRVIRATSRLRALRGAAALMTGLAATLVLLAFDASVDASVGVPLALRAWLLPEALVIGALAGWWRARRGGALSVERTALWLEEHIDGLQWRLVTAADPAAGVVGLELDASLSGTPVEATVRRATMAALRTPLLAALTAAAVLLMVPSGVVVRVTRPRAGDSLLATDAATARDPLARIVVRVTPPAYAGAGSRAFDDPISVEALAGSTVRIEGRGDAASVQGLVNGLTLRASPQAGGWWLVVGMPVKPAAVQLSAGSFTRVLVLDALADSVPVVMLREPARDSVLRHATGRLVLRAEARDDHGLASGNFELIVSSGSGESFAFRTLTLGKATFAGAHDGEISASLSIDSLGLKPGDMMHLRAVARDRNNVNGPGVGASDTRTLRIIRADEYDSVAVEAMPPPETGASALSQRMLLLMTQALEKRRPALARATLVRESLALAIEQASLRKKVGALIFERLGSGDAGEEEEGLALMEARGKPVNPDSVLAQASRATGTGEAKVLDFEGDETPVVKINRPLLEAYNAMWEATTSLEVARPGEAIPPMQRALSAIERARAAERIYLRGKWPKVVVDIARVRLAGKDRGAPAARAPRAAVDRARLERVWRFDGAIDRLAAGDAAGARDALLLLRVELLDTDAGSSRMLGAALDVLRRGGDVTTALAGARRALANAAGEGTTRGALGPWEAGW